MSTLLQSDKILEGAREIRAYLPELLGDQAPAVDRDLAALLAQAQRGETVDDLLLRLLKDHEATYLWMGEYLSTRRVAKGFESLPGRSGAIAAAKYICPEGDYVWYQRSTGQTIPRCPTHGELIVAEEA